MRYENFKEGENFMLSGSSIGTENIFIDDEDHARFIFLLTHFQSPIQIYNVSWYTSGFLRKNVFSTGEERVALILKERNVIPLAFSLTPNNFYILLKNLKEGVISVYMHRILTSYSKYYNAKYKRMGHLFNGPFKARRIKNNAELVDLSAHLHKKPSEVLHWENSYQEYPWSTFQDYIGLNRWGGLVQTDPLLKQFTDQNKYREFVIKKDVKGFL